MSNPTLSRATLIARKVHGCLTTFGIRETARRVWREAVRLRRGHDRTAVDAQDVHERLLVGAAPRSPHAVARLAAVGVTDVLDLRAERRATDPLALTELVRVHWVPTYDDWRPKDPAFYARVVDSARTVWGGDPGARLLVCCGAGEHRGPLGGALVLADLLGDLDEALRRVAAARPVAEFLPAYEQSLRAYWTTRRAA